MQISRDELEKLVSIPPPSDGQPRELPRYEARLDDSSPDNDAPHPDDATKRISYAALLGGSQAGRGGPQRTEVHELPTLIAHRPLTEEAARALALAALPSIDDAVELDEPLPSFEQEAEAAFDKFEQAAATYASPFGGAPERQAPPPRRKLESNPLPVLGFDDSDVTVRAVIEIAAEPAASTVPAPVLSPVPLAPLAVASTSAPTPTPLAPAAIPLASPMPSTPSALPSAPAGVPQHPLSHTVLSENMQPFRAPVHPIGTNLPAASLLSSDEPSEVPGLFTALGQRCSILGLRVPLAVLWLIPMALAGAALAMLVTEPRDAAAPEVRAVAPVPEVSAKPAEEPSLRERVIRGEPGAYETLNQKAERERTTADTLALAKGRAHLELRNLDQLKRDLGSGKLHAADEGTRERLLGFVTDARTAPDALGVLAALPGPEGPDLLYEIWTGTKRSSETTQLARELLYKPEVRQRASQALGVALDLRDEPACQDIPEIIPRARAHGDWRSLHLLGKLLVVRGCGKEQRQDCYPCLRTVEHEESITAAIKVVRRRPRPKP